MERLPPDTPKPRAESTEYNKAVESIVLREHQRVMIDLARYAVETDDLQKFLEDAVVRVGSAIEIDHVKVLRYRPTPGDLVIEAGVGWNPSSLKAVSFAADLASPPGRAFQTGQPVLVKDLNDAPGFRISAPLKVHGIVSLLNAPIFVNKAVWGVLEIDSTILRGFSDDTTSFLIGIAALIGLVIRRMEISTARSHAVAATAQEAVKYELLLTEMQHRMKNNFQMLLSIVSLKAQKLTKAAERDLLMEFGDAIRAMALAHDQLSVGQPKRVVALATYLKSIATGFETSLENIAVEVKADELNVWLEQAVPIGLIVNELVTNSVKHAFGKEGGLIYIELLAGSAPGTATLTIKDNGKGVPTNGNHGSGLRLIRALAGQIRGRIEHESSDHGTTTRLMFSPRAG